MSERPEREVRYSVSLTGATGKKGLLQLSIVLQPYHGNGSYDVDRTEGSDNAVINVQSGGGGTWEFVSPSTVTVGYDGLTGAFDVNAAQTGQQPFHVTGTWDCSSVLVAGA